MTDLIHAKYRVGPVNNDPQTLAVALRRALFTSVEAAAVSKVQVKDAAHEFSVLPGMTEDVLEMILNLSKVRFRSQGSGPTTFEVNKRGPGTVTASDVTTHGEVEIVNPDHEIATLGPDGWLVLSGEICRGTGYQEAAPDAPPGTIHLSCNFTSVRKAACTVESDKIVVSLATDGRVEPRQALSEALAAAESEHLPVEELEAAHTMPVPEPSTKDYTKTRSRTPVPRLTGMHRTAFDRFIDEELIAALGEIFPIAASDGSAELDLLSARTEPPSASADECIDRKGTLAGRLLVNLALRRAEGNAAEEQEVCLGEIPWLSERETFVVDGCERVIIAAFQIGPDEQDKGLVHYPLRFLRSLTDPLQSSLPQAQLLIGELLAHSGSDGFDLSSLADLLPIGKILMDSLRRHACAQAPEETNPLDVLTHLRRTTCLGPGNIDRHHAGYGIRCLDPFHFGRLCYVETPEGPNIGLISSLAVHTDVAGDGMVRTPYLKVERGKVTEEIEWLSTTDERDVLIASSDVQLDANGVLACDRIQARRNGAIVTASADEIRYVDVSPDQGLGASASLIPFLAHDDANRALMGSNMQRQAVPLLWGDAPIVCSGNEEHVPTAGYASIVASRPGIVTSASADSLQVSPEREDTTNAQTDEYRLRKFRRTSERTCFNQRLLVREGQQVAAGQPLAESSSCDDGRLALGKNLLVAYLPWEGYNFEDAVVVSDRLVKEDVLSSLHIENHAIEIREGERLARPANASNALDGRGIVRVGAHVKTGDVLVRKLGPDGDDHPLTVPWNAGGRVLRVTHRARAAGDSLPDGVLATVDVEIVQWRRAQIGDKMSNRHGAKGIIGAIVPEEDMPYLPDGTPVDVLLNPLGVPSRMNLGQVLETHLGWAAAKLNRRVVSPPFFGATVEDIEAALVEAGLPRSGTTMLCDGRNGRPFDNEITVGYLYMMKLDHLVADKVHGRATGPYSLETQQPTGGRSRAGGQRFGEMEIWAAEAHGAGHFLHEMLTVKSDDVPGRAALAEALAQGHANVAAIGPPHSLKTLLARLKGVGFDVDAAARVGWAVPTDANAGTQGMVGTAHPTMKDADQRSAGIDSLRLSLASSETIRTWSSGEITTSQAIGEATADEDMRHIELAVPVCHPWLFHAVPELIAAWTGIAQDALDDVIYYRKAVVETANGERHVVDRSQVTGFLRSSPGAQLVGTGAAALKQLLSGASPGDAASELRDLAESLAKAGTRPEWMVLEAIPVIPYAFRVVPPTSMESTFRWDFNELYARLVTRNEACRRVIAQGAPEIIVQEKARGLQEAVDMLFGNGVKRGQAASEHPTAELSSLSDIIRGRDGKVRDIGKRVDFSGRSVIAPGPKLKLNQCGLPKSIARKLFAPFVTSQLVLDGLAPDEAAAEEMLREQAPEAERRLAEAVTGKVVVLNRAPTLHRYGLQAFEPVLTDHDCIEMHPLLCYGFNADFDGDQMAVHLPLSDAAQAEAKRLMSPVANLLMSRNGETMVPPVQDILLGLYYLTAMNPEANGAGAAFETKEAALAAHEAGGIALHAPVTITLAGQSVETTPGRIAFNAILPDGHDFVNKLINRSLLGGLITASYTGHGPQATADTLDRMKELGLRYATQSGATIGKDLLKPYPKKAEVVTRTWQKHEEILAEQTAGKLSEEEARRHVFDLWVNATEEIGTGVLDELAADRGGFNPVHMMLKSGARGSTIQLRQLSGMRGLLVGPGTLEWHRGPLIPVDISFMEGHNPWQHFISGHGARRGLMDTALKTADAGYLMRRLVVARTEEILIGQEDCGTEQSLALEPLREDDRIIEEVADRAFARVAAERVVDPQTGDEIVAAGELIDRSTGEKIRAAGIESVKARSVLCCEAQTGVCAKCYGADLATGKLPAIGSAVGPIAAHAAGEPAIQLTVATFYGTPRPGGRNQPRKGGLPRLVELERTGADFDATEWVRQATAVFREQGVHIHDKHFEVIVRAIQCPPPCGFLRRVLFPPEGETATSVLAKAALIGETDHLLGLRERVTVGRRISD